MYSYIQSLKKIQGYFKCLNIQCKKTKTTSCPDLSQIKYKKDKIKASKQVQIIRHFRQNKSINL